METSDTPIITGKQKEDLDLLKYIIARIWFDRRLFKHGCFIAPDPTYGDMETLQDFFSHFDELVSEVKKYDKLEITSLNKCLVMYQLLCIRIKLGWLETINEDSICQVTANCKICRD